MLSVTDLSVALPMAGQSVPVLSGVSLALGRGESVGLVGESGSGKSMTALAIMGLLPPGARVSGRIVFDGRDLLTVGEPELCALRGRRIGMVFQEPMTALNPLQTIGAQVAEPLRLHEKLPRAAAASRARELLARVGLAPPRVTPDLYPHQLSGGQRQRVVIAMALACGPDARSRRPRPSEDLAAPLSASALRRAAPARRHRDRTRLRPGPADRR